MSKKMYDIIVLTGILLSIFYSLTYITIQQTKDTWKKACMSVDYAKREQHRILCPKSWEEEFKKNGQ